MGVCADRSAVRGVDGGVGSVIEPKMLGEQGRRCDGEAKGSLRPRRRRPVKRPVAATVSDSFGPLSRTQASGREVLVVRASARFRWLPAVSQRGKPAGRNRPRRDSRRLRLLAAKPTLTTWLAPRSRAWVPATAKEGPGATPGPSALLSTERSRRKSVSLPLRRPSGWQRRRSRGEPTCRRPAAPR